MSMDAILYKSPKPKLAASLGVDSDHEHDSYTYALGSLLKYRRPERRTLCDYADRPFNETLAFRTGQLPADWTPISHRDKVRLSHPVTTGVRISRYTNGPHKGELFVSRVKRTWDAC